MAQWGNTDDAANSVLWAASQVNLTANSANQTDLFGNNTADAFVTGATIGQYGVDVNEATAARAEGSGDRAAHAGWVLRTVGSGGRSGRTQTEVLVAASSITSDAEDVVFEDAFITITSQPSNTSANTTDSENATFTVAFTVAPSDATVTLAWTYANGDAIQAGANVGNTTQTTLTVNSAVENANADFKVTLASTGADSVVSSNATLTITT
jgi:hypothetical protein